MAYLYLETENLEELKTELNELILLEQSDPFPPLPPFVPLRYTTNFRSNYGKVHKAINNR